MNLKEKYAVVPIKMIDTIVSDYKPVNIIFNKFKECGVTVL